MWLLYLVAVSCLTAGMGIIIFGFMLSKREMEVRLALKEAIEGSLSGKSGKGIAQTAESQALIKDISDLTTSLATFAKSLQGLSSASQACLVSVIYFALAAGLAIAGALPG